MQRPSDPKRGLLVAGQSLAGALIGLGLIGFYLDRRFDSAPKFLLAGLLLGLLVGFYDLYKAMFPGGRRK